MLKPTERTDIQAEFAVALADSGDERGLLKIIFSANATDLLVELPLNVNRAEAFAAWVVDFCMVSRWSLTPSLLESLLCWLVDKKGIGRLDTILTRVRAGIDPNPDPYAARWLLADQPFFDRDGLRPLVRNLIEQPDRPLLRIIGPCGSGRSYTREYFDYLSDHAPALHVVPVELPAGHAPTYGLRELVETLIEPMSVSQQMPEPADGSAYPGILCRWFLRQAMQQAGKWVLVLDGFDQPDVDADVRAFVQMLAARIRSGEQRRRLRLVLIDYAAAIPQVPGALFLEEATPPSTAVGKENLVECLMALNDSRRAAGRREIDPSQLGLIAERILRAAPANGKQRLEYIYGELLALPSMPG